MNLYDGADERWVGPEHAASNEALVRRELLVGAAAQARFVALKNDAPTPELGIAAVEQELATMARPFDVVVLGMGEDGHTASLFPGAAELAAGLDLESPASCLAVHPPGAPLPRLSLNLRTLLDAHRVALHVNGERKWQVYQQAQQEGPIAELPVRGVLRHGGWKVEVYWAP
ncbi:MAG: 6-phosphogluconolactonase [Thermoanaerobaculia bacterium]|nr:6-phosphogluconolactonase [Thermoanaerobaculia bacterium]